jgi:hypothetical protein
MAIPQNWYSASAEAILATLWTANPMKIALMSASFVPNRDTQKVWGDVSGSEISGSGYTAGGVLLASKTAVYDSSSDTTHFDAADVTWGPAATFTSAYAVVYDSSGAQPLWSLIDFQASKVLNNGSFVITFDPLGLLDVVAA